MARSLPFNLGLTVIPENSDPKDSLEFYKIYNAINGLASALDAYTMPVARDEGDWSILAPWQTILWQNTCRMYCYFSQTVSAGAMVNIYNNAGNPAARLANAATPQYCRGYAPAAVTAGEYGEIILKGVARISGLTPGTLYYLWNTGGQISATAGTNVQKIGIALDSTTLLIDPEIV